MQQPNGTSIPNFQQTINSITYPQQQQIYFETTNPTSNNSDFYSIQQQIYQTQQIGELNETKQQQNSSEQFTANNGNIINKPKKGLGPGRPPKIKIDNNKREENAGCSNMYEYNNSGILKPDQMQMLSIEAKSANNIMSGGSTNQPNLSTVQFPYGDLSNACFGGPTPFDLSSIPPDYNNLGVAWAGHPSSYSINSAPTPAICGGFGDIDNIYANGLMALPGQLQYELDPMLATGYGVWPTANGYYLGNDPVKLLTSDGSLQISQPPPQQYLGTASTSNNYTGENIQSTATTFYGASQPLQVILLENIKLER
uniref:Uncharacterized protein n=1 Tax=Meloidogyne hapla TaxID=6305 RepID=A0A1I8BSN9_MELHA